MQHSSTMAMQNAARVLTILGHDFRQHSGKQVHYSRRTVVQQRRKNNTGTVVIYYIKHRAFLFFGGRKQVGRQVDARITAHCAAKHKKTARPCPTHLADKRAAWTATTDGKWETTHIYSMQSAGAMTGTGGLYTCIQEHRCHQGGGGAARGII